MARRAPALVIAALALTAACGLGDAGPAAEGSPPPLVTHQGPDGGSVPRGGGGPEPARPAGPCVDAADLTVALPGPDRPLQVVPDCSEREVPVPFTVPRHPPTPGRLGAL